MIPYEGDCFFKGSLVEAIGCVLRGYKGFYHTDYTNYKRTDGAKVGGKIAILGGAGPMGIGAVDLAIGYAGVGQVVVTDLSLDCREKGSRIARVSISIAVIENREIRKFLDGSGSADAASGDYSAAFSEAFANAVSDALKGFKEN